MIFNYKNTPLYCILINVLTLPKKVLTLKYAFIGIVRFNEGCINTPVLSSMTDLDPVVCLVWPRGAVQVGAGASVGAEAGAGAGAGAPGGLVALVIVSSPESGDILKHYDCDIMSLTPRVLVTL